MKFNGYLILLGLASVGISTMFLPKEEYKVRGVLYSTNCSVCGGNDTIEGYIDMNENQYSDSGHCVECEYNYRKE
ncbi:MAG: hypothetical protein ACRCTZ_18305 [Sarcina sp.]